MKVAGGKLLFLECGHNIDGVFDVSFQVAHSGCNAPEIFNGSSVSCSEEDQVGRVEVVSQEIFAS